MRPLLRLEKRGDEWSVVMRSGRVEFSNTCYAKATGVFEYLEARRLASEEETRKSRKQFRAEHAVPTGEKTS